MTVILFFALTESSLRTQKTFLVLETVTNNMLTYNGNGLREENDTTISAMALSWIMMTQLMLPHNEANGVRQEVSAAIKAHVKPTLILCAH